MIKSSESKMFAVTLIESVATNDEVIVSIIQWISHSKSYFSKKSNTINGKYGNNLGTEPK